MSRPIKTAAGTEAQMDALRVIVDKALGYPRKGTHVGSGPHVPMPETWDGTGPTPPGWAKSATVPWVTNASNVVLPLPDDLAAELQSAPAQARLSASERTTVANAIASRGQTVLDGRTPKANAAQGAAEQVRRDG
jgi:hypothetical protein